MNPTAFDLILLPSDDEKCVVLTRLYRRPDISTIVQGSVVG